MNKLVKSNRNRQKRNKALRPKKTAKATDFTKKKNHKVSAVTFNTNLKINNHARNKLEAISSLGLAKSQKDALNVALNTYLASLPRNEKEEVKLLINMFENRDISLKNK